MRGLVLRSPLRSGWAHGAHDLLVSGAHAVVLGDIRVPLEAEDAGFEVRDCLLVLGVLGLGRAWLLRKPLSCGTLAEQVLATGTGGLWVDGCRVGVSKSVPGSATRTPGKSSTLFGEGSFFRRETGLEGGRNPHVGRWPTNVVLVHALGCRREGCKRVRGNRTDTRPEGEDGRVRMGGRIVHSGGFGRG